MMSVRLRILLVAALVLVLIFITRKVRRRELDLRYTLSWYFLATVLIVLTAFPTLPRMIAHLIGIYNEMNMIFFAGFCFSLLIIYNLTVAVSRQSRQIRDLTQRLALYEKDGPEQDAD